MRAALARLTQPWVVGVFALALAARLAFWLLADQPLLYKHQYHYFFNGLRIAEHPTPLRLVLSSDRWRTWEGWTIAPLYYVFEGAVFRFFGPHLEPLRFVQCVLGALTAVGVGAMARELAGPRGWWAGAAYGIYGYAVELPTWTMTENLHVVLLAAAMAFLLRSATRSGLAETAAGGFLLGVSALARSVSSAFLPVAALWRWWFADRAARWRAALVLFGAGLLVIAPWIVRNSLVAGRLSPLETAVYENIWYGNHYVDREHYLLQEAIIYRQPTAAAREDAAVRFALRGIRRTPSGVLRKANLNFWHFLRPEGLHNLLILERSLEPWRHAFTLVFEDAFMAVLVPLLAVFLVSGRASPARTCLLLWLGYYLFLLIVVFQNEVPRYRSAFMPAALAAAAGAIGPLFDRRAVERRLARVAFVAGAVLVLVTLRPYLGAAWRAASALVALRPSLAAVDRGDMAEGARVALAAADRDPVSPRPWLAYARRLVRAGRTAEAIEAYRRAEERASRLPNRVSWNAGLALPRLLHDVGRTEESITALLNAQLLSWKADPWLVLEVAWRELPPPRADTIDVGLDDYGAVRGFYLPWPAPPAVGGHVFDLPEGPPPGTYRWSRHRAWLRLVPTRPASAYVVTLEMGAPAPAPVGSPVVSVRVNGGEATSFTLGPEIRSYSFRAGVPPGEPLVVQLDAPTWSRPGQAADQGVRVDRLTVVPAQ